MDKLPYIHTLKYYSAFKKKQILQYVTKQVNFEDVMLCEKSQSLKNTYWGFPGGAVVKSLPANAGNTGSNPGLGRSHMPWSN